MMLGSSRESLTLLRASLDARRGDPAFNAVAGDLLAIAAVLAQQKSLRSTLADSGQPVVVRTGVAASIFEGKIAALSMSVLDEVVSARWSHDRDLGDAIESLGAQAALTEAEATGTLDRVESELSTIGQAIDDSADLQFALTDPSVPSAQKVSTMSELLGGDAEPRTAMLIEYLVGNLRSRQPGPAVAELASLAAAQRGRMLADVRSSIELSDEQRSRLVAALTRLQGRDVRVNIVIDPAVVGGLVVRVGDQVIDGSIASRLEQARRAVSV